MRKEVVILAAIVVVVLAAAILSSIYYRNSVQNERKSTQTVTMTEETGMLVRPDSPTLGPVDAKITLVEYFDPECEACAAFSSIVKQILKDYDGRIKIVVRYMPFHPNCNRSRDVYRSCGRAREVLGSSGAAFSEATRMGREAWSAPDNFRPKY